jgi:hypothetical protein
MTPSRNIPNMNEATKMLVPIANFRSERRAIGTTLIDYLTETFTELSLFPNKKKVALKKSLI